MLILPSSGWMKSCAGAGLVHTPVAPKPGTTHTPRALPFFYCVPVSVCVCGGGGGINCNIISSSFCFHPQQLQESAK